MRELILALFILLSISAFASEVCTIRKLSGLTEKSIDCTDKNIENEIVRIGGGNVHPRAESRFPDTKYSNVAQYLLNNHYELKPCSVGDLYIKP